MKILHVVPGLDEIANGIAVAARIVAALQRQEGREVELVDTASFGAGHFVGDEAFDEVWVHSMWLPETIRACRRVLASGKPLIRMVHGNLDPLRMRSKAWKKYPVWWLVERGLVNRSAKVVVTCEAEAEWCRRAGVQPELEVFDLKKGYVFASREESDRLLVASQRTEAYPFRNRLLHVLYLGRRHPLKGVQFLEEAAKGLACELHIVTGQAGADLEAEWDWSDVLCLPTLSDNFGLVVAEALQRGKLVITTDGAPAWKEQEGVLYLSGYRKGTNAERVRLLKSALNSLC